MAKVGEQETTPTRLWFGFAAMCLGMFMAVLDIQVVASSLTAIQGALHIPLSQLGWIQTAYLMAEVVAIPLTGILTRALSLRVLFALATLGFVAASWICALSVNFQMLVWARVVQGFFGGMLIPSVFTAVFVLIPKRQHVLATTLAGVAALLAPTLGPLLGGWLTETQSWHWIFLINILPGLAVTLIVLQTLKAEAAQLVLLRRLDIPTLVLFATFLAGLQWLLHEAPAYHWRGAFVFGLASVCIATCGLGIYRALRVAHPFVQLRRFRNLGFTAGSGLSFVLGFGLYGSVYLLSLFLGVVRSHTPLAVGEVLIVFGAAQLLTAPFAAWAETRIDGRILTALGFGLFGAGLIANGFTTTTSDYEALFWPQVLRGLAVMFCLLPATRLALDYWPEHEVAEASGLFNLMRNLGGAIGIAAIDTVLTERTPDHVAQLVSRLQAGDPKAAALAGLPVQLFHNRPMGPVDPLTKALIEPMVRRAALTEACNEAWWLLGALFLLALLLLPAMRPKKI
ncbi:MAG TPA: DHA2 family efflux MFS transporter permease subunit [Rhizomicrobium sp.]|jgi:DHA2 family multidrug resistance protein|nr:DHA2 family efflux MFS transporter permease subunit [Rhizomicrobium sp.]